MREERERQAGRCEKFSCLNEVCDMKLLLRLLKFFGVGAIAAKSLIFTGPEIIPTKQSNPNLFIVQQQEAARRESDATAKLWWKQGPLARTWNGWRPRPCAGPFKLKKACKNHEKCVKTMKNVWKRGVSPPKRPKIEPQSHLLVFFLGKSGFWGAEKIDLCYIAEMLEHSYRNLLIKSGLWLPAVLGGVDFVSPRATELFKVIKKKEAPSEN